MESARWVDIWNASLEVSPDVLSHFWTVLSSDEQERARRFVFQHLRDSYTAAHGIVRQILSCYCTVAPHDLKFDFNRYGKPAMCGSGLEFNLSHSGSRLACAVTTVGPIGIDIEQIRSMHDMDGVARHSFSAREVETLNRMDPAEYEDSFFRCWTRKEAVIKATGEGLSRGLDTFAVSMERDAPARLVWLKDGSGNINEWEMHSFEPAGGYAGALACRAKGLVLRFLGEPPLHPS